MRLVIVGGVAGGATAAARARRLDEKADIILFERGEYISFANCGLPYYVGGVIPARDNLLVTTAAAFQQRYDVDVRPFTQVVAIDRAAKTVTVNDLAKGASYTESYDKLILAPGAEPVKPKLPGSDLERIFSLRTLEDVDRIKAYVDKAHPLAAVVIGGGFIGLEMVENLAHRGLKVTVVEMLDQVMAPLDFEMAGLVHAELRRMGVDLRLGEGVEGFELIDDRIAVKTSKRHSLSADLVIMAVGIRPENELAKAAGLELCERGHIKVNAALETSDPNIYAVGDAVCLPDIVSGAAVNTALAGPANKQARIAADNALGRRSVYKGTLGSSIAKVFALSVAATGLNEKRLRSLSIPYLASYTHSASHATYYPGAEQLAIKLLFAPGTGRLLGAQVVGGAGADKRIDVLATAIKAGLTVLDLEELELAYAPPYSSAKDPVNMAGFVAANILKGDVQHLTWDQLKDLGETDVLLDVRGADEARVAGSLNGSKLLPLPELRARLNELDHNKIYIVYCAVGLRGYLACRILKQHGFKAKNLSGGYRTYLGAQEKIMHEAGFERLWQSE